MPRDKLWLSSYSRRVTCKCTVYIPLVLTETYWNTFIYGIYSRVPREVILPYLATVTVPPLSTCFETSVTVYQSNWHSISEDLKLQQHPYENLTGLTFCTARPWRWKHNDFSKHWQQFSFHGLSPQETGDLQQDYCESLEGLLCLDCFFLNLKAQWSFEKSMTFTSRHGLNPWKTWMFVMETVRKMAS